MVIEQQTFADCVAQHLPFLKRIVCRFVRGDQVAEDIVQETVLKALVHAHQFRSESTLKTWLTSIAINEVYQVYRSKWRKSVVPLISESLDADRYRLVEVGNDTYEMKERAILVRQAVSRLSDSYRPILELCDLQRLPLNEAAKKLGLTLPAAKSRHHRARRKLRPLLAKLKRV